ncbi:MAG: hypothetical protein K1X85_01185 [Ignavibacteria bacterium]|nr:hypothetical protein [Ignavibacteria bacterium]
MNKYMTTAVLSISIFISSCSKQKGEVRISNSSAEHTGDTSLETRAGVQETDGRGLMLIQSKDAKAHEGDSLRVVGTVADVYEGPKVVYLNFEKKFPRNTFSCTIFAGSLDRFGDVKSLAGKKVEVTGKITIFRNKPQMILWTKEQIRVLE